MTSPITDEFTRADSTTNLGSCDQAIPWVQSAGTGAMGISSNQAYLSTTDHSANSFEGPLAYIDHGWSDGTIEADLYGDVLGVVDDPGLVFRFTDSANFFMAFLTKSIGVQIELDKVVAGVITTLSTTNITAGTGPWHVKYTLAGSSITVLVNGVDTNTDIDSFNQTATKHGFALLDVDATERVDNYDAVQGTGPPAPLAPPAVVVSQALRRPLVGRRLLRPHLARPIVAVTSTVAAVTAYSYAGAPAPMVITPAIYMIGTAT